VAKWDLTWQKSTFGHSWLEFNQRLYMIGSWSAERVEPGDLLAVVTHSLPVGTTGTPLATTQLRPSSLAQTCPYKQRRRPTWRTDDAARHNTAATPPYTCRFLCSPSSLSSSNRPLVAHYNTDSSSRSSLNKTNILSC
jgi:hypothetical protein